MSSSRLQSHRWPEALILLVTSVLFGMKGLFSFLWTTEFGGRDLASNYAFTWLMQQNLLHGEIFSWTNQWLLGFPSFQLYPPGFFLSVSSLNIATGQILGLDFWFKLIAFISVFAVPLLTYYVTQTVFDEKEGFFAGFYTLFFIFVYSPVSQAYQVFSVGLVAQGFAFLLLIGSIGFMLQNKRKHRIYAGILLGFVGLSHPFVAVVGFLLSTSLVITTRKIENILPALIGSAIVGPWLLNAAKYLPYIASYTFEAANTGIFLYLILPLIVVGGYQGAKRRAILLTFSALLLVSTIEIPFVTQELRFYTYSLGIGSILAGFGAFRTYQYLNQEFNVDKRLIATVLLIPVIGLSIHADLPQTWSFKGDAEPIYEELNKNEQGRVLVETSNSSIFDSFILQGKIPMETNHWAVNDVHLDSSPSANYILTLESWISKNPLYNSICRTCNTKVSNKVIDQRMDDLGIRYVVARTEYSKKLLQQFMTYHGKYGDYWLFENSEGYQTVESLDYKPVALVGSYEKWRKVNDAIFVRNSSTEIVWRKTETGRNYSATVNMENLSVKEVIKKIENVELQSIPKKSISYSVTDREVSVNTSPLVKVKISHFPGLQREDTGKFNTVILPSGGSLDRGS